MGFRGARRRCAWQEGRLHIPPQHLADRAARQIRDHMDVLGGLHRTQLLAGEALHLLGIGGDAGAELDRRLDPLASFLVGQAEDHGLADRGMPGQRRFHIRGIDIEAARDDHIA